MAKILKRMTAFFLAAMMVLSVSGCKKEEEPAQEEQTQEEESLEQEEKPIDQPEPEEEKEKSDFEAPTFGEQLKEAKAKNDDIIGWLKIDDLKVDGAVVQAEDNKRYERQDEWKQYSWTGSYFADYECNFNSREEMSKNTVIYGHNVHFDDNKDGERFSQLFHFADIEFAKNHPYIYFSIYDEDEKESGVEQDKRPDNEMVWQIFSVFYTTTDFNYIQINKDYNDPTSEEISNAQLMNIITEAQQRSEYIYDVGVTGEDKILTLSTCSYKYGKRNDVRFVVMAKLLDQDAVLKSTVSLTENTNKKTVE